MDIMKSGQTHLMTKNKPKCRLCERQRSNPDRASIENCSGLLRCRSQRRVFKQNYVQNLDAFALVMK